MRPEKVNYALIIRRFCLVLLDIVCVLLSSLLAIATRFEFSLSQIPVEFYSVLVKLAPLFILSTLFIFWIFRIYNSLWEYAGIEEMINVVVACIAAGFCQIAVVVAVGSFLPRSYYVLSTIYLMLLTAANRASYRLIRLRRQNRMFSWKKKQRVMLIGAGEAGRSLIGEIQNSRFLNQKVCCVIDDDRR